MNTWIINGSLKIRAGNWQMARFHARMRRIDVDSICLYASPATAKRQRRQAIAAYKAVREAEMLRKGLTR